MTEQVRGAHETRGQILVSLFLGGHHSCVPCLATVNHLTTILCTFPSRSASAEEEEYAEATANTENQNADADEQPLPPPQGTVLPAGSAIVVACINRHMQRPQMQNSRRDSYPSGLAVADFCSACYTMFVHY